MFRGNPRGSQFFMGSLDSATIYFDWFLWVANCFCPKGVSGGTSLIFWATRPAQNPVKSWRGAGPPGPVVTNLSYRSETPPDTFWSGWRVCDNTYEEKNSTPARPTMPHLGIFCISAPPLLLARIQTALCVENTLRHLQRPANRIEILLLARLRTRSSFSSHWDSRCVRRGLRCGESRRGWAAAVKSHEEGLEMGCCFRSGCGLRHEPHKIS